MYQNQLCLTLTKRLVTGVFAVLFLPRHLDKGPGRGRGGGGLRKIFFRPFGTQFDLKIRGVGAGPGQYTVGNEFLLFCIAEVVKSNLWSFCRPTLPVFCVPSLLTSGILTLPCILVLLSLTL